MNPSPSTSISTSTSTRNAPPSARSGEVAAEQVTRRAAPSRQASIGSSPASATLQRRLGNASVLRSLTGGPSHGQLVRHAILLEHAGLGQSASSGLDSNAAVQAALRDAAEEEGLDLDDPAVRQLRQSGGRALPELVRRRMEGAFGHDFEHVRVHDDADAARAADALNAYAFALGAHLFFGSGSFAPGTPRGDRLLAHELTHVQQHDRGELAHTSGVSDPRDRHELEAYANEDRILGELSRQDSVGPAAGYDYEPPETDQQLGDGGSSLPASGAMMRWTDAQLAEASADRERIAQDLELAADLGGRRVQEIRRALRRALRGDPVGEELVTVIYAGSTIRHVRPEDLEPLIERADRVMHEQRGEESGGEQSGGTPQGSDGAEQADPQPGQHDQQAPPDRDASQEGDDDEPPLDPDAREHTHHDATGHWHTTGEDDITLALNQAGTRIIGRYQARERDPDVLGSLDADESGRMRLNTGRLEGSLERDDERETVFRFEGEPTGGRHGEPFSGTISARGGLLFLFRDDGAHYRFVQGDREADAPGQAVGSLDESGQQDVQQPLSEDQREGIARAATQLHDIADAYTNALTTPGQLTEVRRMEQVVEQHFEQTPDEQVAQVRQELRQQLSRLRVRDRTRGDSLDALQTLRIMAWRFEQDSPVTRHRLQLERADGSAADAEADGPFYYRLRFGLVGAEGEAGAGFSFFIGLAEVEEVDEAEHRAGPLSGGTARWRCKFGMVRGGLSFGPSGGAHIAESTTWKYSEPAQQHWTRSDVPGRFQSTSASAGVRGLDSGPVLEAGRTLLLGRGVYDPLVFYDLGISQDAIFGASGGASVTHQEGVLVGEDDDERRHSDEGPARREQEVQVTDREVVGFDTDVAQLNEAGREALRRLCAENLAILRDPANRVTLEATASRLDDEQHNQGLSERRARNTRSAMRAMIRSERSASFELKAMGERAAAAAGVRDGDDSARWRRVDVRINGQIVLTLRAARDG